MTHWDKQAATVKDDATVNIGDIYQRELEYDFILPHLKKDMVVLEVGCGNGYSTSIFRQHVRQVDAMDVSPMMIERARRTFGETNNIFIEGDVVADETSDIYDAVICVRVLINLKNMDEQLKAVANLKRWVRLGGILVLVEGFRDGFDELDKARQAVGLPPITPAPFNCYPYERDILSQFDGWTRRDFFETGLYDWLTRVYYPLVVGADKVEQNSAFSQAAAKISKSTPHDDFVQYARLCGLVLRRER